MKRLIKVLIFNFILTLGFIASAQTEDLHSKLTHFHKHAMEQAVKLKGHTSHNHDSFKETYHEVRMAYKEAILHHIELKKALKGRRDEIKAYHKVIEMHHMNAYTHYEAMRHELTETECNNEMIKKHAEDFYHEMNNAELSHQQLIAML